MVVEAESHENYYLEIESDSEIIDNEASDEDLALNQEIEDCQRKILKVHHPFFRTRIQQDTENNN